MNVAVSIFQMVWMSFVQLVYLLGVLIACGLLLGYLEKLSNWLLVRAFGRKGVMLTAWLGTPVHELGHLLMCFLWGHRVTRVKLLQLNSPDGVLGYVEHEYNRNSLYQRVGNFFIGVGPLFSGIAALLLGMYYLVPQSFTAFQTEVQQLLITGNVSFNGWTITTGAALVIGKSFFTMENIIRPSFWLFLLAAISISSHIALSREDMRNSANGLAAIFFILFLFNVVAKFFGIPSEQVIGKIAEYNAYVFAFATVALFFSLLTLCLAFFFYQINAFRRRRSNRWE
ncbi:hypothetical protein ACQYAD_02440 [Neobacillus sp. SM06]|uniref:hypothetical protein n=1 Tax=Neobacillus sp. SM06 TaxID=3422492 RepID=UPI003D27873B